MMKVLVATTVVIAACGVENSATTSANQQAEICTTCGGDGDPPPGYETPTQGSEVESLHANPGYSTDPREPTGCLPIINGAGWNCHTHLHSSLLHITCDVSCTQFSVSSPWICYVEDCWFD